MKVTGLETWFDPVDMFVQMKPDLSKSEVEIDGKGLSTEKATAILEHPKESGVEKIVEELTSDQSQQSLAERIKGSSSAITGREDVRLHHPSAPAESHQLHSEDKISKDQSPQ